jgi:hypothetical protein
MACCFWKLRTNNHLKKSKSWEGVSQEKESRRRMELDQNFADWEALLEYLLIME